MYFAIPRKSLPKKLKYSKIFRFLSYIQKICILPRPSKRPIVRRYFFFNFLQNGVDLVPEHLAFTALLSTGLGSLVPKKKKPQKRTTYGEVEKNRSFAETKIKSIRYRYAKGYITLPHRIIPLTQKFGAKRIHFLPVSRPLSSSGGPITGCYCNLAAGEIRQSSAEDAYFSFVEIFHVPSSRIFGRKFTPPRNNGDHNY